MSIQEQLDKAMNEDRQCHLGTGRETVSRSNPAHYLTFGVERLNYMKRNEPEFYQEMVVTGKLNEYLNDVETHAQAQLDRIVLSMAKQGRDGREIESDRSDEMGRLMNNYRHCAAEMVRNDCGCTTNRTAYKASSSAKSVCCFSF